MRRIFFSKNSKAIKRSFSTGFTLIEILVGISLFALIAVSVYSAYANILNIITKNQWRVNAISAIQNEIETARGMKFEDIGILGGYPPGKISAQKNVVFEGNTYLIKATVRSVDDPYDGILGGTPNDTAPADYKIVEYEAQCTSCQNADKITLTTTIAPKGLESTTNNGALFVNVFDAYGQPIENADVNVVNSSTIPLITINDQTNNNGVLQLVDLPTSTMAYAVTVSKNGYSSEKTYPMAAPSNPNPIKPHATVASQQITSVSFAIDKTSSLNISSKDEMCSIVPNFDFTMEGTKLIGTNPDILKYSHDFSTASSGAVSISNLEWDNYKISGIDSQYNLAGFTPLLPLNLSPATTTNLSLLMAVKNPSALLITAIDQNGQTVNDASVKLEKTGFQKTILTGRKNFSQINWVSQNYNSQSGAIDSELVAGEIKLLLSGGKYPTSTSEWLISNTFDLGTNSTDFFKISWNPENQPAGTSLKFQIASNNDNLTWNFLGPDGTENSYYTSSGASINSVHNNNRYFRYKVFLETNDETKTPTLEDISIEFSSSCIPGGQAFFDGLTTGIYAITIEKIGYSTFTDSNVSVSTNWQEYKAQLSP